MRNNICSICKQKILDIDFSKIKVLKIKNFINNNRINKEDYSIMIKKCNCKDNVHKFCILLNILFNYELKCQYCNSFYNITITKSSDKIEKYKIILLTSFLIIIHLILYGISVILIIFNIKEFKFSMFKDNFYNQNNFLLIQYFFAVIIFILNSYFFYLTIESIIIKFKHCYKYFININEGNSKSIDDSKYFKPLYEFYKKFNNDSLRYLVCKRNEVFFTNKITYNKDFQIFIKKNNAEYQDLSNGNKNYDIESNNEDILKLKDSYNNNDEN